MPDPHPLGRRIPSDWAHVAAHPYAVPRALAALTAERSLLLPPYRAVYDQGTTSACVGYSGAWVMSILRSTPRTPRRYDPRWLWCQAKNIDEYPDTACGDDNGTSVRAGADVLRTLGDVRVVRRHDAPVALSEGIASNTWATDVDGCRAALAGGTPLWLGINWYSDFDTPRQHAGEWWIGQAAGWGQVRGGHAICAYAVSDRRQAVALVNSWGPSFPLCWLPYEGLRRLLNEQGECAVVTLR